MHKERNTDPVLEEDRRGWYRKGRNGTGLRAYSREWVHAAVCVVVVAAAVVVVVAAVMVMVAAVMVMVVVVRWDNDVSRLCLIDPILRNGHSSFPCLEKFY